MKFAKPRGQEKGLGGGGGLQKGNSVRESLEVDFTLKEGKSEQGKKGGYTAENVSVREGRSPITTERGDRSKRDLGEKKSHQPWTRGHGKTKS